MRTSPRASARASAFLVAGLVVVAVASGGPAAGQPAGAARSDVKTPGDHMTTKVKDNRTGHEVGNAQGVLDGNLEPFIHEYLLAKAAGKAV